MTIKGGTKSACAACKYQRRKCAIDCSLARYFPADQPKMFLNAHRLFGLSNIVRILKQVDSDKKDEAMRTIIFESTIRAKYPVHGCWGIICKLQQHIQALMEELRVVNATLASCKEQAQYQVPNLGKNSPAEIASNDQVSIPSAQNDLYEETSDENLMKTLKMEDLYCDDYPIMIPIQELHVAQDYYKHDIPFDTNAKNPSFFESKEACESSAESKDGTTCNKRKSN